MKSLNSSLEVDDHLQHPRSALISIHAILQLFAWCFMIPLSYFTITFYRQYFPYKFLVAKQKWFVIHVGLNWSVFATTVMAIFLAIFHFNFRFKVNAHTLCGVSLLFSLMIQLLMGLLRPDLDSNWRTIFNWSHKILGIIVIFLGFSTCYLGIREYDEEYNNVDQPSKTHYLLIAIVFVTIGFSFFVVVFNRRTAVSIVDEIGYDIATGDNVKYETTDGGGGGSQTCDRLDNPQTQSGDNSNNNNINNRTSKRHMIQITTPPTIYENGQGDEMPDTAVMMTTTTNEEEGDSSCLNQHQNDDTVTSDDCSATSSVRGSTFSLETSIKQSSIHKVMLKVHYLYLGSIFIIVLLMAVDLVFNISGACFNF